MPTLSFLSLEKLTSSLLSLDLLCEAVELWDAINLAFSGLGYHR